MTQPSNPKPPFELTPAPAQTPPERPTAASHDWLQMLAAMPKPRQRKPRSSYKRHWKG